MRAYIQYTVEVDEIPVESGELLTKAHRELKNLLDGLEKSFFSLSYTKTVDVVAQVSELKKFVAGSYKSLDRVEDIIEILGCEDYKFKPHHRSILKKIAEHIFQFNPNENTYLIECTKEDAIKVMKILNKM